ncbi:MAG: hypothetical protein JRJ42_05165 [Deltaproteobacteria bacterium]|nr:hypothetical protein [Deltaproteobacteria bacterium]MBW2019304.1 hypothetical protein [Deltaproteobacteria bacterium]MBW2074075.1 hypothetical protein [Deltaproteobacteria bacterium]
MFIRQNSSQTITLSTLGAADSYTDEVFNGLLYSIRLKASADLSTSSGAISIYRDHSTELKIFGAALDASLTSWKEFFPRSDIRSTTGAGTTGLSTALGAMSPMADERFRVIISSSSGRAGETVSLIYSVI